MRSKPRLFLLVALSGPLALLPSCGGSGTGPPPEDTPVPTNVSIIPDNPSLNAPGATVQFSATIRDQRGREMTGLQITWNTSDASVATVSSQGLATAVSNGSTTIIATVAGNVSGWATLTVSIEELSIATSNLASGVVGFSYADTLEASGSSGVSWSVVGGSLPDGLTLNESTGEIQGTPTTAGNSTFTVQATRVAQTATRDLSIVVVSDALGIDLGNDQFVLVPAGSFQMGSATGSANEQPVHTVNITKPFYLQKTEVTQYQWVSIMGSNPSIVPDCGITCPVDQISWNAIQVFLEALNDANPGANFRLPTEAEWEYAARAGTTGDYGGTGVLDEMGWYIQNSGSKTHFVAQKLPNDFGLYDMSGNVFEWVQDWYSATYYSVSPADDPTGPDSGTAKVLRGGSADRSASEARSAFRRYVSPSSTGGIINGFAGFRLAKTPNGGG